MRPRELLDQLGRFAKTERFLALACVLAPGIMWLAGAFYVPLTVAAMLFLLNGVLHADNWWKRDSWGDNRRIVLAGEQGA